MRVCVCCFQSLQLFFRMEDFVLMYLANCSLSLSLSYPCAHTYTHARARKGAHTQSHACTHTQTQTHSHTQMHTHTRTHTYTHIHTHTHRTHPKHRINYLQLINLGFLFGRSTNKIQITEKKEKSMGSRSLWVTHVWHEDYSDQRVPASLSSVAKQHCKELSPVTLRNSGISIVTIRFHSVITH